MKKQKAILTWICQESYIQLAMKTKKITFKNELHKEWTTALFLESMANEFARLASRELPHAEVEAVLGDGQGLFISIFEDGKRNQGRELGLWMAIRESIHKTKFDFKAFAEKKKLCEKMNPTKPCKVKKVTVKF